MRSEDAVDLRMTVITVNFSQAKKKHTLTHRQIENKQRSSTRAASTIYTTRKIPVYNPALIQMLTVDVLLQRGGAFSLRRGEGAMAGRPTGPRVLLLGEVDF